MTALDEYNHSRITRDYTLADRMRDELLKRAEAAEQARDKMMDEMYERLQESGRLLAEEKDKKCWRCGVHLHPKRVDQSKPEGGQHE